MKAYRGIFKKKNGSLREMSFVKLQDIAEINLEFISGKIQGTGDTKNTPEGMELVWDLEQDNFRYFNHETVEDTIKEYEISGEIFG